MKTTLPSADESVLAPERCVARGVGGGRVGHGPRGTRRAGAMLVLALGLCLGAGARAQVNSGSTGADGAFNPTTNTVINLADHPDGIYHHTSGTISLSELS